MEIQQEVQVIERALKKSGHTKTKLASILGVRNAAITELFDGKRKLQLEEKDKAYRFLKLDSVPLKGYVGASSTTIFFELPDDELDRVQAPDIVNENTVAVQIRGDSLGAQFDGWLVFYDHVEHPPSESLFDQLCVVGLTDGRVVIKQMRPSKTKGFFHLVSDNGQSIYDASVEWAAKVQGMRPRS